MNNIRKNMTNIDDEMNENESEDKRKLILSLTKKSNEYKNEPDNKKKSIVHLASEMSVKKKIIK